MRSLLLHNMPVISMLILLLTPSAIRGENQANNNMQYDDIHNPVKEREGFSFLPEAGIIIDKLYFFDNSAGYSAALKQTIDLNILRYNQLDLSLFSKETIIFDSWNIRHIDPYSIRYDMDFANLRWKFQQSSISIFVDHICINIINQNDTEIMKLRWYGYGLKWETNGMRTGHKNDNIKFTSKPFVMLNNLNYFISAAGKLSTSNFDYKALVRGAVRYDIFRSYSIVPYVKGSFFTFIDNRTRIDPSFEIGLRLCLSKLDFNPYARYSYKHDVDVYNGLATDFYFIGFRMETLLGVDAWGSIDDGEEPISNLPEIHFSTGYAKCILDNYHNFRGDLAVTIDFFKIGDFSLFVNNDLNHYSLRRDFGLFPRYLNFIIESGMAYFFNPSDIIYELYYKQNRNDEGNYYRGYKVHHHSVSFRIKSIESKLGYTNHWIDFNVKDNFEWLNNLCWTFSVDRVICDSNYDYDWDIGGKIRWDILRYMFNVPYISTGTYMLIGNDRDWKYFAETGMRMHFGLNFLLYYRYDYRSGDDAALGMDNNQNIIGFRIEM